MTYFRSAKVVRLTIGVSFLYWLFLSLPAVPHLTMSKTIKADCSDAVGVSEAVLAEEKSDRLSHQHATLAWQQDKRWNAAGLFSPAFRDTSWGLGAWLFAIRPPVPLTALIFIYYHYTLYPLSTSLLS
jgi:hypothetical protein